MKPAPFPQANRRATPGKPDSISMYDKHGQVLTCWRMNLRERLRALLWGKVWISVKPGTHAQPPMWAQVRKSVFKRKRKRR